MAINPDTSRARGSAQILRFPPRGPVRAKDGTVMAVIPIGDGSLDYRVGENGIYLCRAVGDEAIAASTRLFGPPTESGSDGHPVWQLQAGA